MDHAVDHTLFLKKMDEVEESHWWFRVRKELISELVKRYRPKKEQQLKILDLGCGTGMISKELESFGAVFAVDPSVESQDFCGKKGIKNFYKGSAENIPFDDNVFDVVVMLDVLEHIKDDASTVKEVRRVLKPGGAFIFFVPALPFLWSEHDEVFLHFRRYTRKTLSALFAEEWKMLRMSYFNFFLFLPILSMRAISLIFNIGSKNGVEQATALNGILYRIFHLEVPCLSYINFPLGVSLLGVYEKQEKKQV